MKAGASKTQSGHWVWPSDEDLDHSEASEILIGDNHSRSHFVTYSVLSWVLCLSLLEIRSTLVASHFPSVKGTWLRGKLSEMTE